MTTPPKQSGTETPEKRPRPSVPQLAEGIDLIGEYEGSGFKETPYLARRADGQVLQLTQLLYLVAEEVDGERNFGQIAERVTEKFGRKVSAENVKFLVEKKLRPLGVLAADDGTSPKLKRADPMLALNFRTGLVPERAVQALTSIFYPLFFPPLVLAVLGGLVALDAWLFFVHGVAQSVRDITYQPILFLFVFGLVVLSAAFHECGHATACRYGGAKPGVMGAGIYVVYPAFFSDVTDVYRLGKLGRVRTDMGGIYFNMIFSLLTAGAYFLTGFEPLLAIIVIQHLEMLHQLLPFLRLDGYYVIADITGVPDMFARIRPILRSLIPGREPDASVTALKPWVQVVVTAWVLTIVPVLLYLFLTLAMTVPRMLATAWDSFWVQYDNIAAAFSNGEMIPIAAGSIQVLFLVLPFVGMVYTFGRAGKNLSVAAWTKTEGKPVLRTSFGSLALVAVGLMAFIWWPNGDYKPIQPGERGTIQASLTAVRDIPTGRPALTPEREAELNGAPTLREQPGSPTSTDLNEQDPATDEPAPGATPTDEPESNARPGDQQPDEAAPSGEQPEEQQPSGQQEESEQTPSEQATPGNQKSGEQAPSEQAAPGAQEPGEQAPGEASPKEAAPGEQAPDEASPKEAASEQQQKVQTQRSVNQETTTP